MPRVFVTRPIPKVGIDLLREKGFDVDINIDAEDRPATRDELLKGVPGANAILSVLTEKMDSEIMEAAGTQLKIIANFAVGYDNIDMSAAKERGITVTNTPDVLTNAVAEHTFALLLSIARRIAESDRFSRAGNYKAWGPELLLGADISGKTLGIVGLGRIGSRVAHHAVKGFDMQVLYYDIKPNPDFEKEYGAGYIASVDELLPQCDFVSIHVPLLDSTRHLINEARLKMMKPTAYLINTSRGPIIDERALAKALRDGVIQGAGLDVYENEPEIAPELKELENVILTPHTASATRETRDKMAVMAAQNIIEALEGRVPPNKVEL